MGATPYWDLAVVVIVSSLTWSTVTSSIKYKFFPQGLSWGDAKSRCTEIGYVLATPRNSEENSAMIKYLQTISGTNDEIWFGGNLDESDSWLWLDGTPIEWFDWSVQKGQPNDISHEKCIRLRRDDENWWNRECHKSFPYVCQLEGSREAMFGLLARDQIPSAGVRDTLTLSSGPECTLRCLADYGCKMYSIQTLSPQSKTSKYVCNLFSYVTPGGNSYQANTRLYSRQT